MKHARENILNCFTLLSGALPTACFQPFDPPPPPDKAGTFPSQLLLRYTPQVHKSCFCVQESKANPNLGTFVSDARAASELQRWSASLTAAFSRFLQCSVKSPCRSCTDPTCRSVRFHSSRKTPPEEQPNSSAFKNRPVWDLPPPSQQSTGLKRDCRRESSHHNTPSVYTG